MKTSDIAPDQRTRYLAVIAGAARSQGDSGATASLRWVKDKLGTADGPNADAVKGAHPFIASPGKGGGRKRRTKKKSFKPCQGI